MITQVICSPVKKKSARIKIDDTATGASAEDNKAAVVSAQNQVDSDDSGTENSDDSDTEYMAHSEDSGNGDEGADRKSVV